MKKLTILTLITISFIVIFTSCKKKYSGCCKYQVHYTNPGYTDINENQCLNDVDKIKTEGILQNYNNLKDNQGKSIGTNSEYTFIDNGCSFNK